MTTRTEAPPPSERILRVRTTTLLSSIFALGLLMMAAGIIELQKADATGDLSRHRQFVSRADIKAP